MTKLILSLAAALVAFTGQVIAQETTAKPDGEATITKATYLITGLHCPPCTKTVESSLRQVKGIRAIKVDWKTKTARVEFDEALLPAQTVAALIAATPHMMGRNMHYAGWLALKIPDLKDETKAKQVKDLLQKLPGIKRVVLYPAQFAIGIAFEEKGKLTSDELIAALGDAGVTAERF